MSHDTPAAHPFGDGSSPSVPVRPLRGIGAATRWLILASALTALASIVIDSYGIASIRSLPSDELMLRAMFGDESMLQGLRVYDASSTAIAVLSAVVTIAAMICWLIWQHGAASSVTPTALRRSPAWHVGSWFIPIVAWWFPFQNIKDIAQEARARLSDRMLGLWWALWIAPSVIGGIARWMYQGASDMEGLASALSVSIFGNALWIAAAALAWIVVGRITDALDPARR
ncbi:DUF4328 domain-containing protein [Microbacterium sp.]|uniref:DUF4328 domain-containing protein n=1 Tax=Microbacterium sp. TaxID=51671 RepID=UPI003A913A9E